MDQQAKRRQRRFRIGALAIFFLIMALITFLGIRWMLTLQDEGQRLAFQETIASLGIWGWFILFAIQYIQIVVAFIPGGPIQIMAGALFGPLGGMLTCLLGTIAATLTVFSLVHHFGRKALFLFVEEESIQKYKFLSDAKRLEFLTALLFFIPGTPKDALTYLFALTPLTLPRFMAISTLARIPAMLVSVLAGNSIIQGQWLKGLLLLCGIGLFTLAGIWVHKRVIEPRIQGKRHK